MYCRFTGEKKRAKKKRSAEKRLKKIFVCILFVGKYKCG